MKVVVDTNILMAGLIADSTVRTVLLSPNLHFYLPEYALQEIEKYKDYLKRKGNYSDEEFELMKMLLLERIVIVPKTDIESHMQEARDIMKDIDEKDSPFVACALSISADGIWSFDADFTRQDKIRIFTTKELIEHL